MKKARKMTIVVSMLLALAFVFSACAPEAADTASEGASDFKAAMITDLGGLSGSEESKGFSDLGWDAFTKAEEELGITTTLLESAELADLEPNLRKMAEENYDIIVGVGYLFSDAIAAVAPDYPDTYFAIVDSTVDEPNVMSLVFAEEQGSFLVGAIAAGMSESGTIGFIGGMESALIEKFEAGYIAGARAINPDITVLSGYTGNFTDVASGKELALTQNGQGADVIYAAAGNCGLGTIEAAAEQGFWAVGVDTNQDAVAPGSVLTSMLKRVEVAVYDAIESAYNGTFEGGVKEYNLATGGVGYSDMEYTKDQIPAELLATVEDLSAMIISGDIIVPVTNDEANAFVLPE